ncbi:hypothetical protein K437DRAFT_191690 [Tilletiaria anomala UBC 951]|uniref:mRNA cap guanine-N(7) methyltransferase n=1 Tax=Tilletiaria anomala (strain ATCC 24038 / CBS 436.72 / UBC 951) TaxID=1037660 RepID=A0A066VN12_TILAU|nr:uncharacterized protein K437DRAFT_191690 [Tilletiaria anomala UBC 951]KDN40164.1 hypothetical protein K437DRAFT_191690 [Tilletiaria anomala UBC 951]
MPGYDPVRDPNPSPTREKADAGFPTLGKDALPAVVHPSLDRSGSSSSRTSLGDGSVSGDASGMMSPVRTRASIADILNPSSSSPAFTGQDREGQRVDTALSRTSHAIAPMTASLLLTGNSIQFGSPFSAHTQLPLSAGGYGRQERSPSLVNILNGGEAGPVERSTPKSRSSSISASRAPSISMHASSSPELGSGASVERFALADSPKGRFATLLHGPSPVGGPITPAAAFVPSIRLEEGGRSRSSEGKVRNGFVVPDKPASRSPDVSRIIPQLPEVSTLRSTGAALASPTTSTLSIDSGSTPAVASVAPTSQADEASGYPLDPTATSSSTTVQSVENHQATLASPKTAGAEPIPASLRNVTTTAGVRRKHSVMVPNEELVPFSVNCAAAAAAEKIGGPPQKKARKAFTDENQEAKGMSSPQAIHPFAKSMRTSSPIPASTSSDAKEDPLSEPSSAASAAPMPTVKASRYAPRERFSRPGSILQPILPDEIESFKRRHQNPLRRMAEGGAAGSASTSIYQDGQRPIENAGEVAEHYNRRHDVGVQGRERSRIFPLRKFNNWIKSILIGRYARDRPSPGSNGEDKGEVEGRRSRRLGPRVMELGCGKGGDLAKWDKARASHLVMIDIAEVSIQHAQSRYFDRKHCYTADFYAFDCFGIPLFEKVPAEVLELQFDNLSLQFCMHYAWSDIPKVRVMLENISKYLRKGGIFIGTIPDGDRLRSKLKELPEGQLKFGNSIYSVEFEQRESFPIFGHKYNFFLDDAVENVPEYVVDWTQFESLAFEYGMKKIYRNNFLQVFEEERSDGSFGSLLERMDVVDRRTKQPLLDDEMWEAASIYQAFAFEKIR